MTGKVSGPHLDRLRDPAKSSVVSFKFSVRKDKTYSDSGGVDSRQVTRDAWPRNRVRVSWWVVTGCPATANSELFKLVPLPKRQGVPESVWQLQVMARNCVRPNTCSQYVVVATLKN